MVPRRRCAPFVAAALSLAHLPWSGVGLRSEDKLRAAVRPTHKRHEHRDGEVHGETKDNQHPAEYFDSFSESESTYDPRGADQSWRDSNYGWDPTLHDPWDYKSSAMAAPRFHESPSGGPDAAWQTHYPGMDTGIGGRGHNIGEWHQTPTGGYRQDYVSRGAQWKQSTDAAWFDSKVNQVDGFGRQRQPEPGSGAALVSWEERAVNTTLSCAEPGCVANATLLAFDGATERARNCKMNFAVHPTDYDDQYSHETVEWIAVNGAILSTRCNPMASGCNATARDPLHTCLSERSLDTAVDVTGSLQVAARISDTVDECAYEGNLLAAVVWVTCMVAPRLPPPLDNAPALSAAAAAAAGALADPTAVSFREPLRCAERGCTGTALLDFSSHDVETLSECMLNVVVNQTDFDGSHGAVEELEFVRVAGSEVVSHVSPGQNPCMTLWSTGAALPNDQLTFAAVSNQDVTPDIAGGSLLIEAKISDSVDECASNGFLLNAYAEVNCSIIQAQPQSLAAGNATSNVTLNATAPATTASFTEVKHIAIVPQAGTLEMKDESVLGADEQIEYPRRTGVNLRPLTLPHGVVSRV